MVICFLAPVSALSDIGEASCLVEGIIIRDLELREGSRFFFTKFLQKVSSNTNKVLSSARWGGVIFGPRPFFGVSEDVQCDKSVHLCTYLTGLYDFCVISYRS